MKPQIQTLLSNTELLTDDNEYTIVRLPSQAITPASSIIAQIGEPFNALIIDAAETTLIIHSDAWERASRRLPDAEISQHWRLITFSATMSFDIVGYLQAITTILASSEVPVMAFSSFSTDHILVHAKHFQTAWKELSNYCKTK